VGDLLHRFEIWFGVAIGLGIAAMHKYASAAAKKVGQVVYARLASTWLVRTAMRTYIRKLHKELEEFHTMLPGAHNLTMPMRTVYTPLSAVTLGVMDGGREREVAVSLRDKKKPRTVVLGIPGAGKSMSLRQQAFEWADTRREVRPSRWFDRGRSRTRIRVQNLVDIPVLVELNRFDPAKQSINGLITATLDTRGFPHAGKWVDSSIRKNRLAVYLDGLDEVATPLRPAVVNAIKDFARNYEGFVIVTCRSAVYENQLDDVFDQTLQVEGFSEFLIRRFLHGWAKAWADVVLAKETRRVEPLADDTVERLMRELHNAPQLMALAKNPFLLTMIAFLYSSEYAESGQALPHTRVAFYSEVTDALLKDRSRPTAYPYSIKRRVLRDLALTAQDVPSRVQDRLALPADQVMDSVRRSLQSDVRPTDTAPEVVADIVQRTGLLLEVDHGDRYQFAHLTLQEFLAADRLSTDEEGILSRYKQDPDTWRETVRLWCGITDNDRTQFVREILALDPLLAFQCLAEVAKIDDALADEITGLFRGRSEPEVVAAFGFVAADARPLGTKLFDALCDDLTVLDPGRRDVAIRSLAATNTAKAAKVLSEHAVGEDEAVYRALGEMGDLAVLALLDRVRGGSETALHALWTIRTPSSARGAVELLWEEVPAPLLAKVALHVGELLALPELRAAFKDMSGRPVNPDFAWVSSRFASAGEGYGPVAARVVEIIQETEVPLEPGAAARWRPGLAWAMTLVPRVPVRLDGSAHLQLLDEATRALDRAHRTSQLTHDGEGDLTDAVNASLDALIEIGMPQRHRQVMLLLGRMEFIDLMHALSHSGRFLTHDEWAHAGERAPLRFDQSWNFRSVVALVVGFVGLALVRAVPWNVLGKPWGPLWFDWAAVAVIALGVATMVWDATGQGAQGAVHDGVLGIETLWRYFPDFDEDTVIGLFVTGLSPAVGFFSFIAVMQPAGVAAAISVLSCGIGGGVLLWLRGKDKYQRRNSAVMVLARSVD
jgi:hypothetical protein